MGRLLEHLARIENAMRIQRRFDRPHQFDRNRVLNCRQKVALEPANAMFGGDRSAKFADDVVDLGVHLTPAGEKVRLVAAHRLADIEMNIAVTQMPEWNRTASGHERLNRCTGLLDKVRNSRDW